MPHDKYVKHILQEEKLAPKKRFGQNFLIHRNSAERILDAADLSSHDTVIEIGVGFGALTRPLADRVKKVIGLEIDAGIVRWHKTQNNLPENVTVIHQDIMKTDFRDLATRCGGNLKIIANLPYSLSNPLLFKLIKNHDIIDWAVLMLQKEVGLRLMSEAGTKTYGVLSVLIKTCAETSRLLELGPGHFHPKPKVDSVVLRFTFQPPPARAEKLPSYDKSLLFDLVNAAFQQRRKTLVNALSAGNRFVKSKSEIEGFILKAGLSPKARAENLTVEDYAALSSVLKNSAPEF